MDGKAFKDADYSWNRAEAIQRSCQINAMTKSNLQSANPKPRPTRSLQWLPLPIILVISLPFWLCIHGGRRGSQILPRFLGGGRRCRRNRHAFFHEHGRNLSGRRFRDRRRSLAGLVFLWPRFLPVDFSGHRRGEGIRSDLDRISVTEVGYL